MTEGKTIGLMAIVTVIVMALVWFANENYPNEERRSCMERLVEPDPDEPNYNEKVLLFGSDVRTCMRG